VKFIAVLGCSYSVYIFRSDIMSFYFPALGNDIFLRAVQDDRMKCSELCLHCLL